MGTKSNIIYEEVNPIRTIPILVDAVNKEMEKIKDKKPQMTKDGKRRVYMVKDENGEYYKL